MGYVYIAAALLSWTGLAFVYRVVESRRGNRYSMSAAMGLATVLWTLAFAGFRGIDLWQAAGGQVGIGVCQGAMLVVLIPLFMAAVARGDLSITWTALTLSFSLGSLLAIVYPGEHPTPLGLSGLALTGAAVVMLGLDMVQRSRGPGHRRPQRGWFLFMALSFVLNGLLIYAYSLADAWQPDGAVVHKLAFLLAGGTVFALGGLAMTLLHLRQGGLRVGLLGGLVGGSLMFVGAMSTLQALSAQVPGHIIYPATTGGSGILVVVLSVALLKERPGRAGWCGILVGLAALVLFALAAGS